MASPKVVVINDEMVQLHLIGRMLDSAGYDTSRHIDSSEALERLEGRPEVDLFVLDLHMPGIDGWKICRLLRSPEFQDYNDTPILVVSATFTGADVEAITADIGADGFLPMPLSKDDLLQHVRDLLDGVRPRARSRALVVEDNDAVARALTRSFEAHGYEVVRSTSLEEGRRTWTEMQPDLVLLDYHLPDGPGTDLIGELLSPSDRTVVIVMTGDTDPGLPVRLLQLGADGYVRKPFEPDFLVELAGKARRERSLLRVEALLERRTTELRESEARYRSLFDAIPDMVINLDAQDRVVSVNDEAAQALGPTMADVEGRDFLGFLEEGQAGLVARSLARVRADGTARFETRLRGVRPTRLDVEVTAAAPEGAGAGSIVLVARDISERRRAEQERRRLDAQVQHAQRLESLGVLAGGIAHDFNNLLVGVMGNASLALLDTEEGTPVYECITQIETASRRAAELTQQILTFSGKGESTMSPQDASAVVSEMGQLLAPAVSKKAKLAYRLDSDLPSVKADPSQLRQVIMNLIMNASDALEGESGRIDVETGVRSLEIDDLPHYTLGEAAKPGPYVSISVRDEGCGMDEETRRQIFDPFFTTKFAGRGLGLAATLGIVRAHGGLVSVESAPGTGTCFQILLPALPVTSGKSGDRERADGDRKGASGTVLVVDDEPSVRMLAANALIRAGFDVAQAESGIDALEVIDGEGSVDLVVLDLTMPSMDGTEVLRLLRERAPDLPVLLSSGYPEETVPMGAMERGRTEFLRKPYSPSELLDALADLAERSRELERKAPAKVSTAPG